MKKIILAIFVAVVFIVNVSAATSYFYDPYNKTVFSSPARLIETKWSTPFGFEVEAKSDVDYLSYLANPSKSLSKASDSLYSMLMNADLDFWNEYYATISSAFAEFDSRNFPEKPDDEVSLNQMRLYLEDSYANRFSDTHKSRLVLSLMDADFFNAPMLHGDSLLRLSMFGGEIYGNGFGWQIRSNMGFFGSDDMLSSNGSNLISIDVRGNVGYAFHLISDRFTIGGSVEAMAIFQTSLINKNLLNARFTGNPINAFSENFMVGLGLGLNIGAMYRHNETLAFTLDLTNVSNFRAYWDFELTDFVDYNGADKNENVYMMPMDIALTALWDYEKYHLEVEFSDVINQLIWSNKVDSYTFDFFAIPKIRFAYDLSESLTLNTRLEYLNLGIGVQYGNLSAEISTKLDALGFGVKVGYSF